MNVRVPVSAEVLRWAIARAGLSEVDMEHRFPRFGSWLEGETPPTLKQLQAFAHAAHVPFGYLMLPEPPDEDVPIPDLRTRRNQQRKELSADLRETIYICQRRQDWYRDFAIAHGLEPVDLVGSAEIGDPIEPVAARVRETLGFDVGERAAMGTWQAAFRRLIDLIEGVGVLVSVNGVVGSDTHRALDPTEFGGFALVDEYAPLIFVNGADTKAAQIFTIVHELAHIVSGHSAISDATGSRPTDNNDEVWCNRLAAEILVPRSMLLETYRGNPDVNELERLAAVYRVSTLVVLSRLYEVGKLTWDDYRARYEDELARVLEFARRSGGSNGGNYYYTQPLRLGRRFARAVVSDTRSGRTAYGEAYRLLGTAKPSTFTRLAQELGVA